MTLHNNMYGSTGLLRLSDAGSGAAGTFRVALMSEWFKTTGFLCTSDRPCGPGRTDDDVSHFGTTASLSVTPVSFLEAFASFRSYANSNSEGRPKLLQVLGDSILGLKAFTPAEPDRVLRFGGEAQLLLVNGTGGVGLDGGGTGLRIRGLATADFSSTQESSTPLRIHANLGYRLDNTAKVVEDTETSRGDLPITRIERFGLGINRTDFVEFGLGAEGTFDTIRPYLAYTVDFPLNRQDYICNKGKATTVAFHDACLGENQNMSYFPSRLTIGARALTPLKGFSPFAALDIGITGTKDFLEEVAPQAPWTLYVGVGYAADVIEAEPIIKTETIDKIVATPPLPVYAIRGTVVEKGTTTPVVNAIVLVQGSTGGGYATGPGGVFETRSMEPGAYTFTIQAEGYKPGQCTAQVATSAPAASPIATADPYGPPPGATPPGAVPPPPPPPPGSEAAPGSGSGTTYTNINCELEALPKMGNVVGHVVDAKKSEPVSDASIVVTDAQGKEYRVSTDGGGNFRITDVVPGAISVRVDSEKYLLHVASATVEARQDAQVNINLNPRPKQSNVIVTKQQIIIRRQINFETDSAVIKDDSTSLMEEVADVMNRNPDIKKVEIQGHTDNTGTREHNQTLSEQRASAVRDWLTAHGIEGGRLEAKGFGQTQPLAPNVTARNRARNRRVQFVIRERN